MKVYLVSHDIDIGSTETFHPTKKEALQGKKSLADQYGLDGVNFETVEFEPTRAGICEMINNNVTR